MRRILWGLIVILVVSPSAVTADSLNNTIETTVERKQRISAGIADLWQHTQNEDAVAKFLEEHGLEIVARPEDQEVSLASNPSDVYLPGPTITYDRSLDQYLIYFNWYWKKDGLQGRWFQDSPICPYGMTCNMGGADAWGLHLDKSDVLDLDYQMLVLYDSAGQTSAWADNPVYNSGSHGAAFEYQDTVYIPVVGPRVYNADSGSVTLWMTKVGAGTVQFRSRMAHTWSSTSITSGTFSSSNLTFQFSSTSNRWDIQGTTITKYTFN